MAMDDGHAVTHSEPDLSGLVRVDSVHRSVYTDPAIFDLEMERVFGRAWVFIGMTAKFPT